MKRVVIVLSLGGTILSESDSAANLTGYECRDKSVASLFSCVPKLQSLYVNRELEYRKVSQIGSSKVRFSHWKEIVRIIETESARKQVVGFVITSGTDTLEETAFFLNLILKTSKPVVVTGAMRPSNALGSDGYLNLLNSVMLARSEKSHGLGVLVCMNSLIFSSRDVTKTHTLSTDTFASYDFGALGYIVGDTIRIIHSPVCDHTVRTEFSYADIEHLDALARVELLLLHADCDSRRRQKHI